MLKLFEVKGFKNFEHTFKIDFSNTRDYKFNSQCIKDGYIKDIIMYGKNSVGKTNFGLAMLDIVSHLTYKNVENNLYDYLVNRNSEVAEFHYVFDFDGDVIDYSYSKTDDGSLSYERLLLNNEKILECDYFNKENYFVEKLSKTLNLNFKSDETSILCYHLHNLDNDEGDPLYKFMKFISNMLWFRTLDRNMHIGFKNKRDDYYTFIFEENTLKEFEELLNSVGVSEKLIVKTDVEGKQKLYFNDTKLLPFFNVASSGTKSLYTFFYWYKTAQNSSFIFIDEFDAHYHYELAETVVALLEKMPNTQVILTTHNTNLLTNRIMRPDCYFVLTDNNLVSIADATSRELREGHNLEKLYHAGEFDG